MAFIAGNSPLIQPGARKKYRANQYAAKTMSARFLFPLSFIRSFQQNTGGRIAAAAHYT
jgi:hypothetical protein